MAAMDQNDEPIIFGKGCFKTGRRYIYGRNLSREIYGHGAAERNSPVRVCGSAGI